MKLESSFFVGDKKVCFLGAVKDIGIYRYESKCREFCELFFVDNGEVIGHLDIELTANHSAAAFEKFEFKEIE